MNSHLLAAQLRTVATRLDRRALRVRAFGVGKGETDQGFLAIEADEIQSLAHSLRRLANRLNPKKAKR